MPYANIQHGNVVILRSGHMSPMLFIGQVVAPPTEKTAMISNYNDRDGTFPQNATRKDRAGIVGVLSMNLTPEQGYRKAKRLLEERRAKIDAANREFEAGLAELIEAE
jgi:hypothetical protein